MDKTALINQFKRQIVPFTLADGTALFLKPWNGSKRLEFGAWKKDRPGACMGFYEKLFALSVCDASGNLLFENQEHELAEFDGFALEQVAQKVIDINGMGGSKQE